MIKKKVNRSDPMIKGVAPYDLAMNALQVVLEDADRYADLSSEDELLKITHRIMWRDFLDLLRSSDYRGRESIEAAETGSNAPRQEASQLQEVEDGSAAKEYYELAGDDVGL